MFEINRSCSPEHARRMRALFEADGGVEAQDRAQAAQLEAEGKLVFIDHTKGGTDCFSAEEMADFRRTPIEQFPEHQRRWGR